MYRFAVQMQRQELGVTVGVDAIVDNALAELWIGTSPSIAMVFPESSMTMLQQVLLIVWDVRVISVAYAGAKYFLLKSIQVAK